MLSGISSRLKNEYVRQGKVDQWETSPFVWIKRQGSSRRVGKIGEQLVAEWCAANGLNVMHSPDSEADRIIGGLRVEIKFSTLWESGLYKFQQLRDQNYEYAICLGISPHAAHCWVISKALLRQHVIGHLPQHRGREGTDTFWLSVTPTHPPAWLVECGGTLDRALVVLLNNQRINASFHASQDRLDLNTEP